MGLQHQSHLGHVGKCRLSSRPPQTYCIRIHILTRLAGHLMHSPSSALEFLEQLQPYLLLFFVLLLFILLPFTFHHLLS